MDDWHDNGGGDQGHPGPDIGYFEIRAERKKGPFEKMKPIKKSRTIRYFEIRGPSYEMPAGAMGNLRDRLTKIEESKL
jgi:hypothetical protein